MSASMAEAKALTENSVVELFEALNSAQTPEEFLASADSILATPTNLLLLPVSLGAPDPLAVSGTRGVDVENSQRVHEYLGEMDRVNACDARLWNYLALATYRSYMEERWPLHGSGTDPDAWKRRVKDRWLLHNASISRGKLVRHGIARLWWVAHLTYRNSVAGPHADPYAYTKEVFKSEDRINAIFDREVGAITAVVNSVLNHAIEIGAAATDKYLHRIMQFLTLTNGYRDIGMLDESEVKELIRMATRQASAG